MENSTDYEIRATQLLLWARAVLSNYWFSSDGMGDEYNNDEVIEVHKAIDEFLGDSPNYVLW